MIGERVSACSYNPAASTYEGVHKHLDNAPQPSSASYSSSFSKQEPYKAALPHD
jgi:hypothetical protein